METWLLILAGYLASAWLIGFIVVYSSQDELAKDMPPCPCPGVVLGITCTIAVLISPIILPITTFKWARDHIQSLFTKWSLRRRIKRIRGHLKDHPEANQALDTLAQAIEERY